MTEEKKTEAYEALEMEIIRFETEDAMSDVIGESTHTQPITGNQNHQ